MSDEHAHGASFYVKIWGILLVLLVISIIGPELGIRIVTLITAFGIAVVKAWMVAAYFMHLKGEKKFVHYMLYTMLIFMALLTAGIMVDINKPQGRNWVNTAALHQMETNTVPKE